MNTPFKSMKIKNNLLLILLTVSFLSCEKSNKSELVLKLESIFYNDSFAKTPEKVFNTADYGAIGDGKTLNTEAIQKTIDAAAEAGGGKVIFEKGVYLSGAIFVKSNVEFHINEGVTIKAIQNNSKYPEHKTRIAGIEMEWPAALINVYQQKNVRITGKGTIDGNGKYWWDKFWGDPQFSGGMWVDYKKRNVRWAVDYDCKRIRPVVVYESEEVLLKDFTVERAGFWTISLTYSNKVHVDGLIIRNNINGHGPSSDGINTDSSKDILVENCDIDCNDDNLCLKSGKDADGLRVNRPVENVVYRNCITRSGHGLITLGSETSGGMKNIEVYGLEAVGTNIGIRFKSAKVRGGVMQNIWFHDIKMEKVVNPFHFELNWYPEYSYPTIPKEIPEDEIPDRWRIITQPVTPPELGIPEFKDIRFSNMVIVEAKQAFYANAYQEKPINNLVWENISIEAQESGIINHARNWKMKNVTLKTKSKQTIELNNCVDVEIPEFSTSASAESKNKTNAISIEEQIKSIREKNKSSCILPVDSIKNATISIGDTIKFTKNVRVYIFPEEDDSLSYFEPLGDGFYYSKVEMALKNNGNSIEVAGQKSHTYTFLVKSEIKPNTILKADSWSYDSISKNITIVKTGAKFDIQIK